VSANALSPSWSVLIYADLDGLKHINDSMGHRHGDSSIMAFAGQVQSAIRKDDLFARVGGDEFVILMNVRDEAAGLIVADRLNHSLNVAAYHEENTRLLSSLGVLILPPGARAIDTELRAADMLMYEAKRMKIGLLVATAEMTSQAITLSRHLAQAQPANRRTAIRAHHRGSAASIDLATAPPLVEQPKHIPVITSQPDRLTASQR
ncbi:MAG: GGDEF domain-containing protein, partial [Hyphomicrobiales bacterium]